MWVPGETTMLRDAKGFANRFTLFVVSSPVTSSTGPCSR